jgi:hypothetical protein
MIDPISAAAMREDDDMATAFASSQRRLKGVVLEREVAVRLAVLELEGGVGKTVLIERSADDTPEAVSAPGPCIGWVIPRPIPEAHGLVTDEIYQVQGAADR